MDVKIASVNYCYDIRQMIECNKKLKDLTRKRGIYKLHLKKYMKEHNLTKAQVQANPELVPVPSIKSGLCKKERINLKIIDILMHKA